MSGTTRRGKQTVQKNRLAVNTLNLQTRPETECAKYTSLGIAATSKCVFDDQICYMQLTSFFLNCRTITQKCIERIYEEQQ